jgi:hypothetical protein
MAAAICSSLSSAVLSVAVNVSASAGLPSQ